MKPSDALLDALAHVEAGVGGLYSAKISCDGDEYIDAVLGLECFGGTFALPQSHRATILALAYTLAKEDGK